MHFLSSIVREDFRLDAKLGWIELCPFIILFFNNYTFPVPCHLTQQ